MTLIERLENNCRTEICEWAAGTVVLVEGGASDSLFILLDGELEVWTCSEDRSTLIGHIQPGGLLGEVSLLSPGPATATVRATVGCRALRIGPAELERLRKESPRLARDIVTRAVRELAGRIRSRSAEVTSWN